MLCVRIGDIQTSMDYLICVSGPFVASSSAFNNLSSSRSESGLRGRLTRIEENQNPRQHSGGPFQRTGAEQSTTLRATEHSPLARGGDAGRPLRERVLTWRRAKKAENAQTPPVEEDRDVRLPVEEDRDPAQPAPAGDRVERVAGG